MKKKIFAVVGLLAMLCLLMGATRLATSGTRIREIRAADTIGRRVSITDKGSIRSISKLIASDTKVDEPTYLSENSFTLLVFYEDSGCYLYTVYEGAPAILKENIAYPAPGEWIESSPYAYEELYSMTFWSDAVAGVTFERSN